MHDAQPQVHVLRTQSLVSQTQLQQISLISAGAVAHRHRWMVHTEAWTCIWLRTTMQGEKIDLDANHNYAVRCVIQENA